MKITIMDSDIMTASDQQLVDDLFADNCTVKCSTYCTHGRPTSTMMTVCVCMYVCMYSICGQHAVSFFLNSSAQHRGNEAEPDSNGNKNFQSGPNVPCQSAQTDKSVSSA